MRIYGYHADVSQTVNSVDELRLTVLWRERWALAGFEPFILSEHDAQKHPRYEQAKEVVASMPTINPKEYEEACWLRWFALSAAAPSPVSGAWLADFDAIPRLGVPLIGQLTDFIEAGGVHVFQTPCCPSLAWGFPEAIEEFCARILERKYGRRDHDGREHHSDQYALDDLMASGFVKAHDVVKLWTDKDWEKAPVVHFANAVTAGKLEPRWRGIPDILPL
jgi:hypothetical protein